MRDKIRVFDKLVGKQVTRLPKSILPIMVGFTWIGEPVVTVGIGATVLGYGLALNKASYITIGSIAIVTILVGALLKIILRRTRPRTDYVETMFFNTYSFPSGHAIGSLVSFGLAALVITNKWPMLEISSWLVALVCILIVSLSRIYLGAHYASDVIGGWIVGAIGLAIIVSVGKIS